MQAHEVCKGVSDAVAGVALLRVRHEVPLKVLQVPLASSDQCAPSACNSNTSRLDDINVSNHIDLQSMPVQVCIPSNEIVANNDVVVTIHVQLELYEQYALSCKYAW